jgi:hypothetical protein
MPVTITRGVALKVRILARLVDPERARENGDSAVTHNRSGSPHMRRHSRLSSARHIIDSLYLVYAGAERR